MRTLKYLRKIFNECLDEVKALDIPVGHINGIRWGKLRKKWGICVWHKAAGTFDIVISAECQGKIISARCLEFKKEILHISKNALADILSGHFDKIQHGSSEELHT